MGSKLKCVYVIRVGVLMFFTILVATACVRSAGGTSNFPTGTFVSNSGTYRFMFTDNGSWTISQGGGVIARGTFSIQGNEITWETDNYCDGIGAGKATYTWTFKNDTLLFNL